jgi:HTH-type transcriptional regulator/antitoxin HigA
MIVKPIRTEAEYEQALQRISALFDAHPEPGSPDADEFHMLYLVIEAYESEHYPMGPLDPIEAIKFHMDQKGLTSKDLVPLIGPLDIVDGILAGTCELTLPMIRRLHKNLGISAESLIGVSGDEIKI